MGPEAQALAHVAAPPSGGAGVDLRGPLDDASRPDPPSVAPVADRDNVARAVGRQEEDDREAGEEQRERAGAVGAAEAASRTATAPQTGGPSPTRAPANAADIPQPAPPAPPAPAADAAAAPCDGERTLARERSSLTPARTAPSRRRPQGWQPRPAKRRQRTPSPAPLNRPEATTTHGSYGAYYARRVVEDRIPLLPHEWTQRPGARVLDVGCNEGSVALMFAHDRAPVSVVALDIDYDLVSKARARLRALLHDARKRGDTAIPKPEIPIPNQNQNSAPIPLGARFPFNVCFRHEDFAAEQETLTAAEKGAFDVVLMLSVTKWVHLHGGDAALKRFFGRARDCLRPGGVLVLEPQPSLSYKRATRKFYRELNSKDAKHQSPAQLFHMKDMKLRPEMFADYLQSTEGGFCRMQVLRDVRERGQPFNRPVLAFFKPSNCDPPSSRSYDADRTGTSSAPLS